MTFIGKSPSIGVMLFLIMGGLTLMVGLLAFSQIRSSLRESGDLATLERVSAVTNQLFKASEDAAFERDVALAALDSNDAGASRELRLRLIEARRQAIASADAALLGLSREGAGSGSDARVRAHLGAIAALRTELDAALTAPARRRPGLERRWEAETSALVVAVDDLWLDFVRPYAALDAVVTLQLRYNLALHRILDYSGRERSQVGRVLADGADATLQEIGELNHGQGVIDTNWRNAAELAGQIGIDTSIRTRFADARSQYDALHGMLNEAFYGRGGGRHDALPISPSLWFELSDQYYDALDALRSASRASMRAQLQRLIAAAHASITFWSITLAATLGLCGLGFWLVSRRIVKPINDIVDALGKTAHGERAYFSSGAGQAAEIAKLVGVLEVFQDQVETIHSSARALDEKERRLSAIVDNAMDGLFTMGADGVIQHFNPACERIFGWRGEDIIGTSISRLLAEPYRSDAGAFLARYMRMSRFGSTEELAAQRKNGEPFPIEFSLTRFVLPEGAMFSGIIRDISARKEAEAALVAHAQALELSNKELDDFAYIASHDLKEPLRGIHNHARFLLEDNAEGMTEDSIRRLNRLITLSQRMERLVNDLLYFSRLGRQDLAIQSTDIGAVITDIEGTLDHFLEERHARIVRAGALPTIICDRPRVCELFRNLITNAVKYNESAEKLIEIGAVAGKALPSGGYASRVFYVKDNGCGIAPEFHQEVFRIFKRLQNRASEADGTGVGLTFVKKIVERHGGEIWIESALGQGATFFFTLEKTHDGQAARAA